MAYILQIRVSSVNVIWHLFRSIGLTGAVLIRGQCLIK